MAVRVYAATVYVTVESADGAPAPEAEDLEEALAECVDFDILTEGVESNNFGAEGPHRITALDSEWEGLALESEES
jgi:hypothetical protein